MPPVYTNQPADPFLAFILTPLGILFGLAVLILIFLIIREFVCWYWKINEGIEALNGIEDELAGINKSLQSLVYENTKGNRKPGDAEKEKQDNQDGAAPLTT